MASHQFNDAQKELHSKLIARITAEDACFDMRTFTSDRELATCDTARCMAGHLEALYPELAKEVAATFRDESFFQLSLPHALIARHVYERVTGVECLLDFYASNTELALDQLTADMSVDHINGQSGRWPLLSGDQVEFSIALDLQNTLALDLDSH